MKCQKCQTENIESAKFCGECGAKLQKACPRCAFPNDPGNKFCNECGHNLSHSEPAVEIGEPASPPEAMPLQAAPPSLPEGERRQATVLFSDLTGYTAMNETLDPEETGAVMNRIKEEAVRIVEGHGGVVNQFVGDEILALFGIPEAHEEDPARAVKAALQLHEMVRKLSPEVEERIGKPLRMHTGVNTGLIVTNLRDERDGLFGITGDAVNIGARLKSLAEPDDILVSHHTQRLIAPFFKMEALAPLKMKGKAEQVVPYRVLEKSKIESRFEAAEQKGFKAFAGRQWELDTLHALVDKIDQKEGQFVTVAGEAGVGKSRLLYEFRHSLDRDKITVLQGRCQPYGVDTPYLPFLDGLRRGLQLKEEDNPAELLKKTLANIKAIDPVLEQYIPIYLHLLSIQSEYQLPEHLQGRELRNAMEIALAAILTLNSQHGPMVLIMEDWHWSDEASRSALKHLIGVLAPYALLVVVTYRLEYEADWGHLSYYTPIFLKTLDIESAKVIIKSLVKADQLPRGLGELIQKRTGGNPLFIEEVCYSLMEQGLLSVQDGRASLNKSLEELSLPSTVHAIIRTRLDRLDKNARELIQRASVIGRVFSLAILKRIHSTEEAIADLLESLKNLDVIHQTRVLPEAEYAFRHVPTQMVIYETLLLKRRAELHGAIGKAIEEIHQDRLEEQYSILAYHFAKSGFKDKAVQYCLAAGDQASDLFANHAATAYYKQALEIAQGLGESSKGWQWQIDASLKLAAVGNTRQDIERDNANLQVARDLAEELGDKSRLVRVLYWLGRLHYVLWEPKTAFTYAGQSLEIAEELDDYKLATPAVNLLGRVYWQLSKFKQASQMMETSVEQMHKIGNSVEEASASAVSGYLLSFLGEFERARQYADRSIRIARELKNPFTEANAYHLRGCVADQQGNWDSAIADYDEAIRIAETAKDLFRLYLVLSWKGRACAMSGDPQTGRGLLEESIALAEKIGTEFWRAWQKTALASCCLMLAQFEKGLVFCGEGLSLGEKAEDKYVIAFAKRTFAELLSGLERSDFAKAERDMLEAIRILREIEARPELARSYMSYGKMLKKSGRLEKAGESLGKSIAMFGQMNMVWDADQARRLTSDLD